MNRRPPVRFFSLPAALLFVWWLAPGSTRAATPVALATLALINGSVAQSAGVPSSRLTLTLYVDDDAPGDPGPDEPGVSDPMEDGTAAHPFDRIQEALDAA